MFRAAQSGYACILRYALPRCIPLFLCLDFAGTLAAAGVGVPALLQDGTVLAPLDLGVPPGCQDFVPAAINNGAYPSSLVVLGSATCEDGSRAYTWRNGTWQQFELPAPFTPMEGFGGGLASVADDHPTSPTMSLWASNDFNEHVWTTSYGQTAMELPAPNHYHAESALVDSRGDFVVGGLHYEPGGLGDQAVRWSRTPDGWSMPEVIALGLPEGITADGSMAVGNNELADQGGWIWSAKSGESVLLGYDSMANGIADDGRLVVGSRDEPCTVKQCNYGRVPVYWTPTGAHGGWDRHDLELPDWFGVDNVSWAVAVADIGGEDVIVGVLWALWEGEITYSVAWFQLPDGGYGEPVLLETLSGEEFFDAGVRDINRNGIAVGWAGGPFQPSHGVLWQLVDPQRQAINAGHAGAWFDPVTAGQGVLLDVEPTDQSIFVGWFTYTPAGSADAGESHWYTAQGHYQGSGAELTVYETLGGQFNQATETTTTAVGTLALSFGGCRHGQASYALDATGLHGGFPIQRLVPGSDATCQQQVNDGLQSIDINPGMGGAWFNPSTPGQGVLLDVGPDAQGEDFLFLAWFTWGNGTASGQRWLTAQGPVSGAHADLDVHETRGGMLNAASAVTTSWVGQLSLDFADCNSADLNFSLTGLDGATELTRLFPLGRTLCEQLAGTR